LTARVLAGKLLRYPLHTRIGVDADQGRSGIPSRQ
jgi:hypothetical protein